MRSRWAILLAPVTFAALFELARMGTDGPMVDSIHLGSNAAVVGAAPQRFWEVPLPVSARPGLCNRVRLPTAFDGRFPSERFLASIDAAC